MLGSEDVPATPTPKQRAERVRHRPAGYSALVTQRRSTTADLQENGSTRALFGRRLILTAVLLLVVFDLGGVLGVRTDTVSESEGGYTLRLDYPATGRAGLDVRWRVHVSHEGGFDKELTLAVTGDYFDIFETQGFFPEPSEQVRDGETLYLTFDAPESDTFTVDYDAYIQPASQVGRDAHLAVVDDVAGPELVSVDYETRLVP